jgi:ubiquinone/menaquinone biosynthesis C-methylase UbiE
MIDTAKNLAGPSGRILDYGCGEGAVVVAARAEGLDMVGTDIFYPGSNAKEIVAKNGYLNDFLFEFEEGGALPFPDQHFDAVVANQVFEHIRDMQHALSEIHRVLKPGGAFLNIFPSFGCIREGHIGIPLAHWLSGYPKAQAAWSQAWHAIGFGYHRKGETSRHWAQQWSEWVRNYTVYRTMRTIKREHRRLFAQLDWHEPDYVAYRLASGEKPKLAWLARHPFAAIARIACRSLASMVLVARRAGP